MLTLILSALLGPQLGPSLAADRSPLLRHDQSNITHFCRVVVYRDYQLPFGYYADVLLAPECPDNAVGRVRRTSTLNTRSAGASYQPIDPPVGAWTVTSTGDDIPNSKQFIAWNSSWRWEWWNGQQWVAADVL